MRVTAFYRRLGLVALALAMLIPQSGIMVPASLAQTADQDQDGLPDSWETGGVNVDPDGEGPLPSQFINLPAMGPIRRSRTSSSTSIGWRTSPIATSWAPMPSRSW